MITYTRTYFIQLILTAVALVLGLSLGKSGAWDVWYLGVLVALIGIPHGSTDFIIFKELTNKRGKREYLKFGMVYLVAMAGVVMLWMVNPVLSLLLFIGVSIYHFGQSNIQNVKAPKAIKFIGYCLSGAFVVLVPIAIHFDEAYPIITTLLGTENIVIDSRLLATLPRELLLANIWLMVFLGANNMISIEQFFKELIKLSLLFVLFQYVSLLVAFTTYFVFWHSWSSIEDQLQFLRKKDKRFNLFKYYLQAAPNTIISFIGMALLVLLKPIILPNYTIIDIFFLTISVITLPHIIIIEQLYKTEDQSQDQKVNAISLIS